MKGRNLAIAVMALAVLLVGCGSSPDEGPSLPGTRWVLVTLRGESPLPDRAPTAGFTEDQISGSAGCNTYFGTYEVSGSEITIGDVARTEMWCMEPDGVMDQEEAFLAALCAVAGYQVDAGSLELRDEAGTPLLVFAPREAEAPSSANVAPDEAVAVSRPGSGLVASIDAPASLPTGEAVTVSFTLANTSSEGLFALKWFTPLEGLAGDIFQVQLAGADLPYHGKMVKRGAPVSEDYVWIDAGGSISAEIDLAEGYDFSQDGQYTVQFRPPRLSHVARTVEEQADSLDVLETVPIPCEPVTVTIGR